MIQITRNLHSGTNAYWSRTLAARRGAVYLSVEQHGIMHTDSKGTVLDPVMEPRAVVRIGPSLADKERIPMEMESADLRALAMEFVSIADRMDAGTHLPVPPTPSRLLFEDASGDVMFMGDLKKAEVLVERDRTIRTKFAGDKGGPVVHVMLCDDPDDTDGRSCAEWGVGPTREHALRYAFGAYFGPADDEYDEPRLIAALEAGGWEHPGDCRYCAAGEGMAHNYEPTPDDED